VKENPVKKYNSIFILILLSGFVFAQNDITLEKNNIFGNVRKISIFQTDYEDVFGEIQEKKNELIVEIQFNIEGLCTVHDNGQAETVYKYDGNNMLVEKTVDLKDKKFSYLGKRYLYKYNTENMYEIDIYDLDSNLLNKEIVNSEDKRQTIVLRYDNTGKQTEKKTISFDDRGNQIRNETIDKSGTVTFLAQYEYDLNDNCIKTVIDSKHGLSYSVEDEYNEKNFLKKRRQKSSIGEDRVYMYDYKYDSDGNWMEKNTYIIETEFGEVRKVLESKQSRIIEYY